MDAPQVNRFKHFRHGQLMKENSDVLTGQCLRLMSVLSCHESLKILQAAVPFVARTSLALESWCGAGRHNDDSYLSQ